MRVPLSTDPDIPTEKIGTVRTGVLVLTPGYDGRGRGRDLGVDEPKNKLRRGRVVSHQERVDHREDFELDFLHRATPVNMTWAVPSGHDQRK